jgi:hypothetical protein
VEVKDIDAAEKRIARCDMMLLLLNVEIGAIIHAAGLDEKTSHPGYTGSGANDELSGKNQEDGGTDRVRFTSVPEKPFQGNSL